MDDAIYALNAECDAMQDEIVRLEAENAKLRKFAKLDTEDIDTMSCLVDDLRAENTKLRDVVAILWECCAWETDSVGWCDGCDYHDEDNGGCKVEKVLHELGIEVG